MTFLVTFFVVMVAALLVYSTILKDRPQDLPWTKLDLDEPIGFFTGRKLARLDGQFAYCRNLLDEAGISYQPLPPTGRDQCQRVQNINLPPKGVRGIRYEPSRLAPSCPVVAALAIWEHQVVQTAAIQFFGQKIIRIRQMGSFNCRPIAGSNRWSEHATGNAVDIAGFTLANGEEISLLSHWEGDDPKARFLRAVRNGSCDLFATVLSPDYNAAHADHFHFDQARSGGFGYRLCR